MKEEEYYSLNRNPKKLPFWLSFSDGSQKISVNLKEDLQLTTTFKFQQDINFREKTYSFPVEVTVLK